MLSGAEIACFLAIFCAFLSIFFLFSVCDGKRWQNLFLRRNNWFQQANRVQSTHSLVEIYNTWSPENDCADHWVTLCYNLPLVRPLDEILLAHPLLEEYWSLCQILSILQNFKNIGFVNLPKNRKRIFK